ncbi:MAG: outer membrane beta-barrel protein [Saprospiraceae bacterium]
MKSLKLTVLLLFITATVFAQEEVIMNYGLSPDIKIPRLNLGAEIQYYPSGWVYAARADLYLGKHVNWNFRLAYNDVNRKDLSPHNLTEVGGGFGASLGYRYFFGKRKGLFLGGRADIWQLDIDWTDKDLNMMPISGTTAITVFQPTVEVGYQFKVSKHWTVAPAFAGGFEVNVVTKGEDVRDGLIGLIGVNAAYKLFN